ncbi:hypothetical protein B0H19DRAFT_1333952 [Mycena capillaripes]|nr:hypothetical protein B0H19DRAFT_1333952 [Mycena capillaripes]
MFSSDEHDNTPMEAHGNIPELDIPLVRDAFFGYPEEKSQQQIDEKYLVHIRAAETTSHATPGSLNGFQQSVFHSSAPLVEDPLLKERPMREETLAPESVTTSELMPLLQSFRRCLELRDKYLLKSRQRLGDDPRHYDGKFPWSLSPRKPSQKDSGDPDSNTRDGLRIENCLIPEAHRFTFQMDAQGVIQVYDGAAESGSAQRHPVYDIPSIREYFVDLDYVLDVISNGPAKSFAFRRLKYLASEFATYSLLNEFQELAEMKRFYNIRKVDTHIHHSSSMNQKHLLRFIKSKMNRSQDDIVIFRDGAALTLKQVFDSLKLTADDLSIDTLDMHAHSDSFHRFDKFNLKYNPIGESRLREIFLKTDNYIQGRYLAELTKELMADLEQTKYQNCEWRISIYGRSMDEWDKLAKWIVTNNLYCDNVRWLIQVPRLYDVYKANGSVENFEDIIRNIFVPLFEVTKDPSMHPELHVVLQRVVGFDTVDDESKAERRTYRKYPYPRLWNIKESPPYSYWIYYMFANMASLNNWRQERGFNTFILRPHAGEAGDTDHLTSAFLTSHSISHRILLRKLPALRYLFYLKQIGIAMSPLSNNALFLSYDRNPLPDFFQTGLNVSLSTDDPLQFHFTKEPLLEEYSVAAHIYRLPQSSLAELARNSVIQSGFEMQVKRHWLGDKWYLPGAAGNEILKTNVPSIRLAYRHRRLMEELNMVYE